MTPLETVTVGLVIVAGTAAAIAGALSPELAGLLGVALGYGGKGLVNQRTEAAERR